MKKLTPASDCNNAKRKCVEGGKRRGGEDIHKSIFRSLKTCYF